MSKEIKEIKSYLLKKKKKVFIKYNDSETSLKNIVELLDSIGYEPDLNLQEENKEKKVLTFKYKN